VFDGQRNWPEADVAAAVQAAAAALQQVPTRVLATVLDNSPAFLTLDEAASAIGCVHVPLPPFFTPAQMRGAVAAVGAQLLLVEPALVAVWPELNWAPQPVAGRALMAARTGLAPAAMPAGTVKITFTSGTTGAPKGVCLGRGALEAVTGGLVQALAPLSIGRHLNALPFAVLLENIAGLMAPRRQGATLLMPPLATLGLTGSSGFDAAVFDTAVRALQPHSLILLPQMLRAWCAFLARRGQRAPASLKLVAVGGAAVGAALVQSAWQLGIPACEGYGLSEGASVQTLNLPGAQRAGSVGRLLPHARLRVAEDGELLVAGSLFSGYLGDTGPVPDWWPSGDLGHVDDDGFVHIAGRKKNVLITAFGRNVSPEWVETALRSDPAVLQAVVLGEGAPALGAVLWPTAAELDDAALQAAVDRANAGLPDYAQVRHWLRAKAPFDTRSGMATANGRPRRLAVAALHAELLPQAEVVAA
jgi:long-subunit acyl-CoA synthetase (AMP-forming)